MSNQFHPSTAKLNINTTVPAGAQTTQGVHPAAVDISGMTPETMEAIIKAVADAKDEKAKADRKAKATAVGQKLAHGAIGTGTVTAKVGKTVWNGTFGLLKTALNVVEHAPANATKAVVNEYKKA